MAKRLTAGDRRDAATAVAHMPHFALYDWLTEHPHYLHDEETLGHLLAAHETGLPVHVARHPTTGRVAAWRHHAAGRETYHADANDVLLTRHVHGLDVGDPASIVHVFHGPGGLHIVRRVNPEGWRGMGYGVYHVSAVDGRTLHRYNAPSGAMFHTNPTSAAKAARDAAWPKPRRTKLSRDRRVPLSVDQAALVKAHGKKKSPTAPLLALADWAAEQHSDAPAGKWFAHVLTHPKAKVIYRGKSDTPEHLANISVQPVLQHPEHPDVKHGVGVGVWHRLDIRHPRHSLTVYSPVESRPELHEAVDDFAPPSRRDAAHATADAWADEHGLADEVPRRLARRTVPVGDADTLPLLEAHPTKGVKAGRVTTPLLALADLLHERHGHEPVGKWIAHTLTKPGVRVRRTVPVLSAGQPGSVNYSIHEHRPDEGMDAPGVHADAPRGVYHIVHIDHPRHRLTIYAPVTHANELHEAAADLAGESRAVAAKAAEFAERHGLSPERLARRAPLVYGRHTFAPHPSLVAALSAPAVSDAAVLAGLEASVPHDHPIGEWFKRLAAPPVIGLSPATSRDETGGGVERRVASELERRGARPYDAYVESRRRVPQPAASAILTRGGGYFSVAKPGGGYHTFEVIAHAPEDYPGHEHADDQTTHRLAVARVWRPGRLSRVRATTDTVVNNRLAAKAGQFVERPLQRVRTIAALLKRRPLMRD